ncbi:MAG: HEPN domain-containing protein [Planctomycetaceae bacterium]|nr:HEPN domain-containing protein [Planctomycetaceae bacterium]
MITARDFLRLAGRLAVAPPADEAQLRTAVSRAYYSAFHSAKDYLASLAVQVGHNHGELHRCLLESGHARAKIAGRRLADLHSFRVKADYDLRASQAGTPVTSQRCVELANDIFAIVDELDSTTARLEVKSGIEAYRRKIGRA